MQRPQEWPKAPEDDPSRLDVSDPPRGGSGVPQDLLKNVGVVDLSRLKENDILVIRGAHIHNASALDKIMDALKPHLPKNVLIWLAHEGESIEVISEDEMNRLGWYRKKQA